jgi:hypothetical protein
MRWFVVLVAVALLAGCGASETAPRESAAVGPAPPSSCAPAAVHRTGYPGPVGIGGTPWIAGSRGSGLIGVLAYWPPRWHAREARIYAGGVAPGPNGINMKTFWAFVGPAAAKLAGPELIVRARRMDGPGSWHDSFAAISYVGQAGVPSYASIIALPKPGCWRLTLTTGKLEATVDMRAVPTASRR